MDIASGVSITITVQGKKYSYSKHMMTGKMK